MTAFGGALTDPTKIMGSRIGAYIVDAILATVVIGLVFVAFDVGNFDEQEYSSAVEAQQVCNAFNQTSPTGERRNGLCFASGTTARVLTGDDLNALRIHLILAGTVFGLLNYVLLTCVTGGSLGKLLFGLRVVTARGQRAGPGRNLVRWLFLIVDTACCWLPGLLTSFNSKGHRRIGDMVAGTYVVHRSAEGRLLNIPGHLVVQNRQDPYVTGYQQAPGAPAPAAAAPTGIDAPVFDASRNTYVRYDQASGTWFQWDEGSQSWIAAQQ